MTERTEQTLRVRDARADETDAISRLIVEAYSEFEPNYPGASWDYYISMVGNLTNHVDKAEIVVAEQNGELTGAVLFYADGSVSGQGEWPAGWAGMLRLAVAPGARRQGVAKALVDECVRRCHERGVATLALHTTEWMAVARGMYERMGFVREPAFDFFPRPGIVGMGYKLELQ